MRVTLVNGSLWVVLSRHPLAHLAKGISLTSSQKLLELSSRANPHHSPNQGPQGGKRPPMTSTGGQGAAGYRTPGAVGKRGSESPVDVQRGEREAGQGHGCGTQGPGVKGQCL